MTKNATSMPPVMILCGGKGTRLRDVTELDAEDTERILREEEE